MLEHRFFNKLLSVFPVPPAVRPLNRVAIPICTADRGDAGEAGGDAVLTTLGNGAI
jgi:hypothetical protein